MEWIQIRTNCKTSDLDAVTAIMSVIDESLMIEDLSDAEENLCPMYGELLDDSILNGDKAHAKVSLFVEDKDAAKVSDIISFLRERFSSGKIEAVVETVGIEERDWANEWKKYFRPMRIGKKIIVTPPWEKPDADPDDTVIVMDPGMAFGTGSHETTRLCLALLEKHIPRGCRMLDVGTGSGILAIAGAKLGASSVFCCDLDPEAVRVARENAAFNGCPDIRCEVSDLLKNVDTANGAYTFVTANIVSDIILRMTDDLPKYILPGTKVVLSGIIAERENDIREAMEKAGFSFVDCAHENDWCALVYVK